ncbi:hypothetical protein HDU85_004946 [Gaertneriomyces sp. JEL0708]|nr:hypothetical protein HDU85_004946 [Gaertneriomyces sp. JEL0708]
MVGSSGHTADEALMSVWGQTSRLWGGKPPPPSTMTPYTSTTTIPTIPTIPITTTTLPRLPELSLSINTSSLLRPPPHLPSSSQSSHSVQRPSLQALLNHNDSENDSESDDNDDDDDNSINNNINSNETDTDTMKRRSSSSDMDDGNSSSSSDAKRKYACPSCSLTFRRTEHLLRHKLTHSGEKPYGCDICSRGFSRMDALRRHQKVHAIRPPSPTLSHLQPPPATTLDSPSSSSSCASSDDGLGDDHVVLPRPTSATSIRRPHFLPSPEPAPVPRTGPSICPLRLQDLSSSPVSILANGDRVLYHCPVRGCRDMLSSDTLSHKLESLRHPDAFHQTPPTIQHANRDLLAFITHIFAHHAIPGICRDCSRTHDRSDYFSIENAPCILPFHHPSSSSSSSTSNAIGPCASLQSILNGSAPLPPSLSNQSHQRATTTTHSGTPDDSLLRTLAQCAAQQLELESPSLAAYRVRKIQDLLN